MAPLSAAAMVAASAARRGMGGSRELRGTWSAPCGAPGSASARPLQHACVTRPCHADLAARMAVSGARRHTERCCLAAACAGGARRCPCVLCTHGALQQPCMVVENAMAADVVTTEGLPMGVGRCRAACTRPVHGRQLWS
eukprot:357272-Chlamydomonas_euryale.AAC.4